MGRTARSTRKRSFYLWANRRWRWDERRLFSSRPPVAVLVGYGLWLLFLAILPFAAVAKAPALYGFDTRVTLLFGLPIALLALGFIRLLFATRDGRLHRAGGLAVILLLPCSHRPSFANYHCQPDLPT